MKKIFVLILLAVCGSNIFAQTVMFRPTSVGIYLEQVIFRYFNMGIGTVGYIGLSDNKNPFGLYSHLGFEYPFANRFHFLAAYQSEMIFTQEITMNNAFMLGIGINF